MKYILVIGILILALITLNIFDTMTDTLKDTSIKVCEGLGGESEVIYDGIFNYKSSCKLDDEIIYFK